MSLFTPEQAEEIRQHFEKNLTDPVEVIHFTQAASPLLVPGRHDCQYCTETRELLEEVATFTDKIDLTVYDLVADADKAKEHGVDAVPVTIVRSPHVAGGMRYWGVPSGYEFAVIVSDLVDASRAEADLQPETVTKLAELTGDVNIKVFVTPT